MTFTVTYREKDGTRAEIEIEAANRAACVAACKARGITPTTIREGRQDGGSPYGHAGAKPAMRWIVAAVLCVVVLGGVWWWLGRSEAPPPAEPGHVQKPKVEKPKDDKPKAKPSVSKPAATPAPSAETPAKEMYLGQEVVSRTSVTNADGSVRETVRTADGKLHGITHPAPGSEPIFKNAADQAIAMALSVSDTVSSAMQQIRRSQWR